MSFGENETLFRFFGFAAGELAPSLAWLEEQNPVMSHGQRMGVWHAQGENEGEGGGGGGKGGGEGVTGIWEAFLC